MALPTKITLRIVTPERAQDFEVDEVSLPGVLGDFGVLPGHTPFFSAIRAGSMWYRQGTTKTYLLVAMGFAEVLPDQVTLLAQVADRAEDLDDAKAEAGMRRAEEMIAGLTMPVEIDFERARLALLRELHRLQADSRRGGLH